MLPASLLPQVEAPEGLLRTLHDLSLAGVIFFEPLHGSAGGTTVDLAYVHLNAAAQQTLGLPECPTASFRTLDPHTFKPTGNLPDAGGERQRPGPGCDL